MKKLIMIFVALISTVLCVAQELNTSKMATSGQGSNSEEARYILGLVRNGRADLLNNYFDIAPWKIQAEIDVYKDTAQNASVSIFCVAVDLGNIDVVKAFVDHGIGPKDLCRVQTFTTKTVIISKADRYIHDTKESSSHTAGSSSSSSKGGHSLFRSWFSESSGSQEGNSSYNSSSHDEEYHQVSYGEKKVVKTYFANPLDFASDEMFDYLWEQGFRSNNLFTIAALADAKANDKFEVYNYIMANKQELLSEKPFYISEDTYNQLLQAAEENPNSLATQMLTDKVLGSNSAAQAKKVHQELESMLEGKLQEGITSPTDTLGYSAVLKDLSKTDWNAIDTKNAENAKKREIHNEVMNLCKDIGQSRCIWELFLFLDCKIDEYKLKDLEVVYSKPGEMVILTAYRIHIIDTLNKKVKSKHKNDFVDDVKWKAEKAKYAKQGYQVAWKK